MLCVTKDRVHAWNTNLLSLGSLRTSWTHPSLRIRSSSLHATPRDIHVSLANALYYYGVIISSSVFQKDISNIWLALNAQNHMHAPVFFTLICFSHGYERTREQMNLNDSWLTMDILFTFQLTTLRYFLSSCSQTTIKKKKKKRTPPKPLITSHGLWARCLWATRATEVITAQQQIHSILHPYSKGMQMDNFILPIA